LSRSDEYHAYIRSPEWAEKKRRYRASDLPQRCVVCNEPKVDLHHRTYSRFKKERLTDLVPLCRAHHDEAHKLIAKENRERKARGKGRRGNAQGLATAKELDYIRRLGGTPKPHMTSKEARAMYNRLSRQTRRKKRSKKIPGRKPGKTISSDLPFSLCEPSTNAKKPSG
jgi:hypothetical protein